jgi:hypothetical protein
MKFSRIVPPLRVISVSKGAVIRGSAPPWAWIDGVNLSADVCSPISNNACLGRADNSGRFECRLSARVRDILRLRWRRTDGSVGDWAVIRVPGRDRTRTPQVATFRMGTVLAGAGCVHLVNISNTRPIAEPDGRLRFVNRRTRRATTIHLNARGSFRSRTTVTAEPGDAMDIYGFCQRWIKVGRIEIPRSTPAGPLAIAPFEGATRAVFRVAPIRGRVFAGRPRAGDVVQGALGNCHLAAAAAAVAHARPEALELRPRGGSYEATVFSAGRARRIVVDRELYYRPAGQLLFGQNGFRQGRRPTWWPILEKAVATAMGGYHALERGGTAHCALHMITGLPARHRMLAPADERGHWRDLVQALAAGSPAVASTRQSANGYRYSGIVNDHCYTVLSCREHRNRRWIRLRNPWGEVTPLGFRRWRDGVFEMPWLSFVRYFSVLSFLDTKSL